MIRVAESDGAVTIDVRVIPRSSRSGIAGELDGALKVRLSSPPVDGAANEELIKLLSKKLQTAKSNIEIVSGQASRSKKVRIAGVTAASVIGLVGG